MDRLQASGIQMLEGDPTCGHMVIVSRQPNDVEHAGAKLREDIYLCWDHKTIQGARVAVVQPSGDVSIVTARAPMSWPDEKCDGFLEPSGGDRRGRSTLAQQQRKKS
eukprot:12659440-Prorocentrum_lima.AAC.1